MISIDTDILRQLVAATSTANEAINEAVEALERITTHNDWGCREKTAINEYTLKNKTTIRALQEKSRSFLSILGQISGEFDTSEQSISGMFSSVDSLISGVLSAVLPGANDPHINGVYHDHTGGTPPAAGNIPVSGFVSGFAEIWADISHSWVTAPDFQTGHVTDAVAAIMDAPMMVFEPAPMPSPSGILLTGLEGFEVNNLPNPISICRMSDIQL